MIEPPSRLLDAAGDSAEAEAARLLADVSSVERWSAPQKAWLWRRIERSARRRPSWQLTWAPLSAVAGAAALVLLYQRAPSVVERAAAPHLTVAPVAAAPIPAMAPVAAAPIRAVAPVAAAAIPASPQPVAPASPRSIALAATTGLALSPDARYRLGSRTAGAGGQPPIQLDSGALDATLDHPLASPLVVVTPRLRVRVAGTRFHVGVTEQATTVSIEMGSAVVEAANGRSLTLPAGESIRSDDPRLAPVPGPRLAALPGPRPARARAPRAAPEPADCAELAAPSRATCYERLAAGDDLAAQNASYTLGAMERDLGHGEQAIARFRIYERRFPTGVLAPEAAIGIVTELLVEGRVEEANREARRYLVRFPDGPHRAAVERLLETPR